MATFETDDDNHRVRLRSYQSEMLEESLKRNVIVAMDTGSGKTHVAIARIQAELERSAAGKVGIPLLNISNRLMLTLSRSWYGS